MLDIEYERVNDPRYSLVVGKIKMGDKIIKFKLSRDYKSINATLMDDMDYVIHASINLDFRKGAAHRGSPTLLDRNGSRATKTAYIFNETKEGIYLTIKMLSKSEPSLAPVIMYEGIVINKFQWLIMQKRFEKYTKVTIEDIIKLISTYREGSSRNINGTKITMLSNTYGKKRVYVENDMNPDGFILWEDGHIEEKSIMDVVETWSEKDQDLFMLRNFTSF